MQQLEHSVAGGYWLFRFLAHSSRRASNVQINPSAWLCVLFGCGLSVTAMAQTVMVVGTQHLSRLSQPPSQTQLDHSIAALSEFKPTRVCIERMSGERIEAQFARPDVHGKTFWPQTHGRPLASMIVPLGVRLQLMLETTATDARRGAHRILSDNKKVSAEQRTRAIGLLIAAYEFHTALLNWSYLSASERTTAKALLGNESVAALNEQLASVHEAYSLALPLARRAGLYELCTADSLQYESQGMATAMEFGGLDVLADAQVKARLERLQIAWDRHWQPGSGEDALTRMLWYFNSDEFASEDRRLQWETLREFDNSAGAFHRRLMYWHARTAEITAELFRALAQGPEERVMLIIGAAHRPFTEASLRSQPWVTVQPAQDLLRQ